MLWRYKRRQYVCCLWIIIFSLIIGGLAIYSDNCVRPIVEDVAINQAQSDSEQIINKVIYDILDEQKTDFNSIISIKYDKNNVVTSVNTDTVYLAKLKSLIIRKINTKISDYDDGVISIKLGSFFANEFLNGRGPEISFSYEMANNIFVKYSDKFISAGINQTKHRLMLNISTELYIVTPLLSTSTKFDTEILLNETVIVGNVPNSVTNLDIN